MSDDLKAMLDAVGRRFSDSEGETRRLFETTAESLRGEIRAVAEGVMQTREDLVRETAGVRDEVRRTADETQAMIRF
jgi:hypothetical protein